MTSSAVPAYLVKAVFVGDQEPSGGELYPHGGQDHRFKACRVTGRHGVHLHGGHAQGAPSHGPGELDPGRGRCSDRGGGRAGGETQPGELSQGLHQPVTVS